MNRRSIALTLGVLLVGLILGLLIVWGGGRSGSTDEHGHDAKEAPHAEAKGETRADKAEPAKGPHGGRLLSQEKFALEVTIFEKGVPPEFRLYAYDNGKPVDPSAVKAQLELQRLGRPPETIAFRAQGDYLRGNAEIVEPHSFTIHIAAEYQGQAHRWDYEQIEGRVRMEDAAAKGAGIDIRAAGPAQIQSILQLSGEIQFNQDRVAHVVPRLAGVAAASLKNVGDEVRKGDLLAIIESQTLVELKSDYMATRTRLELARTTYEREKRLWEEKISAEQDFLASRQALSEAEISHRTAEQKLLALGLTRAALAQSDPKSLIRYEVRAPLAGVIVEKHLGLGEAVKEDASIFTIADLSTVWAEMTVYPKDLNGVRLGQKATVKATAFDSQASGRVSYVGSLVGEQTRSAKARVTLPNPDRKWRPGLFVTVELVQDETQVAVAVPLDAIQTYRDWKVVFGRFGEFFEARPVELGRSDGKTVEIKQGLAPGERYAGRGSYVVKAELGKAGASHDH